MYFVSVKAVFSAIMLIILFGYWVFNFITIYHLMRFGVGTQPKKIAAAFFFGSVILFFVCATFFLNIDREALKNRILKISEEGFNITYSR